MCLETRTKPYFREEGEGWALRLAALWAVLPKELEFNENSQRTVTVNRHPRFDRRLHPT